MSKKAAILVCHPIIKDIPAITSKINAKVMAAIGNGKPYGIEYATVILNACVPGIFIVDPKRKAELNNILPAKVAHFS